MSPLRQSRPRVVLPEAAKSFAGDDTTVTQTNDSRWAPRETEATIDGQPTRLVLDAGLTLDDLHAAIEVGRALERAERVDEQAEIRARELLLKQAGEWRNLTIELAQATGPNWAEAMRMVCDS
ncbi:MAG: hypothetical protein M3Y26_09280 [Actinomycetota bacterium]|nr:hypothetical protein [Actinomycetota bacterium]